MSHLNIEHARVEEQRAQMEEIDRLGICPFCREHLEKHHKAPILFETKYWVLTRDDYPYEGTKDHFLIVSQRHILVPSELLPRAWGDIGVVMEWLSENFPHPGAAFVMRFGNTKFTGASVSHLHAHVIYGASQEAGTEGLKAKIGYKHQP